MDDVVAFEAIPSRCRVCGMPFVITAGEVQFYTRKQLSLPVRCAQCREARRRLAMAAQPPTTPPPTD